MFSAAKKNSVVELKETLTPKGKKSVLAKLDKIDKIILDNLQHEGRMTNVELSRKAGISAPPCLRRVKTLEDEGVIVGYNAILDNQALGFNVVIYAEVALVSQNDSDLREFEEKVQSWPGVRECYMVTGGADFLLKIVAKDFDDYQEFLSQELTTLPKVSQVKTRMVVRTSKRQPGVPIETIAA
jgi:DNA-binding Lrp family transcriptional regulator